MESKQPMDRLLVENVGFGKTEVAMRAAFKAVNDHKGHRNFGSNNCTCSATLHKF